MSKTYNNPSPLYLIAQIIKKQNEKLIENYCKDKKMLPKETEQLKKEFIKVNHYYPNVVQKQNRETLQCYLIK